MRSIIDIADFTLEEIRQLIATGEEIAANPAAWADRARGKLLATLFFEPSTRTRLSFEAAMARLGGATISVADGGSSGAAKGETVADTARVVGEYADLLTIRHPADGSALVAAEAATVPVVNSGDGGHFHPTQTLTELLTIHREFGRFGHLTVAFAGDLHYSRTVHSLISALSRFEGNRIVAVSPPELALGERTVRHLRANGTEVIEVSSLAEAVSQADVLYMTRIQKERFGDPVMYERLKEVFVLDADVMRYARPDMIVMHPLPRVNEIATDVDSDPRARYFGQTRDGMLIRMALIDFLLRDAEQRPEAEVRPERIREQAPAGDCPNPRCVSRSDRSAVPFAYASPEGPRCGFCDTRL